jgi:hypothetical protein
MTRFCCRPALMAPATVSMQRSFVADASVAAGHPAGRSADGR